MSVDSAVASAWDVLKMVVIPIKHQFGYVISSKSYAQDLQKEVGNLAFQAERIHNAAEVATNNLRKVYNLVMEWQESVEQALKEARDLLRDFEEASKTCCYGTLPNPNCRYQFSKKAKDMIKGIQRLAREGSEFRDISFSDPTPGNVAAPTSVGTEGKDVVLSTTAMASTSHASTLIELKDDGVFKSRASIIQDIMDALADNINSVVGVHGMGGVGKSTLLVDAERGIKEETLFGLVTKADVSANPDIKRIQEEIAHELGLDFKNQEFVSVRAKILCERLQAEGKKKKVLIILDNLWERLDLKSVGIPCGHDNKVIGCKLLLTSRDQNVLRREMGCDRDFHLVGLPEEEARSLFERMAGDKVHDDEFKTLVDEALHKCAGFPFLIIAIAKYFKNSCLSDWKDALRQIDMSTNRGISKVINETLQLSYDHLKGEEGEDAKSLLRLCVACGVSKPHLEDLVRYSVGLRLFREDSSMEEAKDRMSSLVHTLQASSLLLDDEDVNGFKIHDLVRGFVASIALRDHPFLVLKDENKLVVELSKDKLKSCKAICFPYVNLEELPKDLDCPELQMFMLLTFTSNKSLEVPDSYFNSMRYLMVLKLSGIHLSHSPSPFQFLENLRTLFLNFCSLENVAILGELKGLQILSFKFSNIHQLPKEIGQLVELRLLDLSYCSQLEIIEPGVLRNLIKLEELYMENSFHQWNDKEQTPPTNASLIELNNMKNLCTLHVSIPNPSLLPKDLNFKQLTKFKIRIGNAQCWIKYEGSRTLYLKLDPISNILQEGCIQSILHKTDTLFLDDLKKTKQSICALSQEGFPKLKHLQVQNSPSIQNILQRPSFIAFKMLESLLLKNLINLEKISHNNISLESFNALKVVRVDNCDKMEVLFPLSGVRKLPQLEEIEVVCCKLMRGIVEVDDSGKVELCNLRVLKLRHLPCIKNFLNVGSGPSSSTSHDQVSTQITFFNGKQVSIPSLESLTMEKLPNMQEMWNDESPLDLSNLQSLVVVQCKSLSKVISFGSLLNLHKLHTLTIKDCVSVQEIFDLDEPSSSGNVATLFELTTLELSKMWSLRRIWNKNPHGTMSLHNLKKLVVEDYDNLEFMFFPSMIKSLAHLRDLTISNCKKMEAIIMEEEGVGMGIVEILEFPMLINLRLKWLESLTCFSRGKCSQETWSQGHVQSCFTGLFNREVSIPSLESLIVEGLPNMQEIWSDESPLELSNLHLLVVVQCKSLSKVISLRSLLKLHKLHTLTIKDCILVQEIFDVDGPSRIGIVAAPFELITLTLSNMRSLRRIWNKNPCGIVSFHNLKKLVVEDCDNLRFIFFPSMIKSLAHLRDLTISNCEKMEAIIIEEEGVGMEIVETLEFPMLTNLHLKRLERLMCFSCRKCSRETWSQDHVQSRFTALFNREVSIPSLESLTVEGLPNMQEIWSDESPLELSNLHSLVVVQCKSLSKVINLRSLLKLHKLHTLTIKDCISVQEIFDVDGPSSSGIVAAPFELTTLTLSKMWSLRHIWNKNPCGIVSFHNLKKLVVEDCYNLGFIFFPSMIKSLSHLRDLTISNCEKMEAIIIEEEGVGMEIVETLEFPMLTGLRLKRLERLMCFSCRKCSRETWSQEHVQSRFTALFNQEVSIPSLESLTVEGLPNMQEIWSNESPLELSNLQSLVVTQCESLSKVISLRSLLKLHKLHTLTIKDCVSVQEIFELDGPSGSGNVVTLFKLTTLELSKMRSLRRIWNKNPCGIVSFHNLKKLVVKDCDNLGFMFFPSMIKSLAHLRDLTISTCEKMEAIITEEEGVGMEIVETLEFPMLTKLHLKRLERLMCFSCGKCSRETWSQDHVQSRFTALFDQKVAFPRLETLEIFGINNFGFIFFPSMVKSFTQLKKLSLRYCKKMEAIIMEEEGLGMERLETLAFPLLTDLKLYGLRSLTCFYCRKYSREAQTQDCIKSHSTTLFNEEVAFPNLERLDIEFMDNIKKIWDNQVATDSFHDLKSLCVVQCNKLVNLVPSCILGRLLNLESLEARDCGSLEVVFEPQQLNPPSIHPATCFLLKKLRLINLLELKCIWYKELPCQVKFQCLRSISISRCKSLTSLFPASLANDLIQLENLKINECGIAELMENEEGLFPKSPFPKLTSLKLRHLIELKCIYTGTHALQWPALKTLEVHGCYKVEIFASQPKNEMTLDKQSLFLIEKGTFPNLQELKLDLSKRMEIWHGHFHDEEFFYKLRVCELRHLSKESPMSIYHFIESLTNLEKLVICESYPEEPSSNEAAIEGISHELKETLPFLGYIRHLQTLHMSHCDGLSNLFTPIIVENLVVLTKLSISKCKILTKVISDEDGEEGRAVAFNQLKYMELDGLTKLRCFSPGGYTLIFPLLKDVIVNECPNMKFFSIGPIEAPKLERVQVDLKKLYGPTKYQYFWKGNLNITLENMCKEMATVVRVKFMRLYEFPELIRKWHGELNPIKSSLQLETLMVDKCPSLINAIPSKLMLALQEMTRLLVGNCESLEEIFDLEGLDIVESSQVLPKLRYIKLINLPKLRQLWNKDLQGMMCFNSLYSLTLYNCNNLRHAFVPSMACCLANIKGIKIEECGQMEGVIVDEEGPGSAVEKITLLKLTWIRLECLPNLTSFLSGKNHTLDCPKMKSLNIAHCPKMRSLTWQSSVDIDHGTPSLFAPQVQFPRLELIVISNMDNLSNIWTDSPQETLTFDCLRVVEAWNCKSLKHLFPHWVATSLTQLTRLQVGSCGIERIVSCGDDILHANIAQVLSSKLTTLVLHDMPQLQSVFPNLPTLNWPVLKDLYVTHCEKLNMSSFATCMNSWVQRDDQQDLSYQEAHSSFERDFPMLERLSLDNKNIQMIQDGKFPKNFFGKPKALILACFHDEKAIFSLKLVLERFQNLQSLVILCSSFEEIFPDEGLVDEGKHLVLENLTTLKLSKLHNLKSVCREDSLVSKILQRIKTFEVSDCPCLTTIFLIMTSFRNLTNLVVNNSSGLLHLVTASMVTNLVNLTWMTIIGCERIKEVVADDENGEGKVIFFWKLKWLTLQHLPSLECFSPIPSCIFRFPSLSNITVKECPKMKTFSKGMLSTPELRWVSLFEYKWKFGDWKEGDNLNTTIQKLSE